MQEGLQFDKKSIRTVVGKTADFNELAKDCVAFANAQGGHLYYRFHLQEIQEVQIAIILSFLDEEEKGKIREIYILNKKTEEYDLGTNT